MDKLQTLQTAYKRLLAEGRVTNKKDFAQMLGYDYSGVISAMNGNPKYLSDTMVAKAVALTDTQEQPDEKPEPQDITIPASVASLYKNMAETNAHLSESVKIQQDTIKMLVEMIKDENRPNKAEKGVG